MNEEIIATREKINAIKNEISLLEQSIAINEDKIDNINCYRSDSEYSSNLEAENDRLQRNIAEKKEFINDLEELLTLYISLEDLEKKQEILEDELKDSQDEWTAKDDNAFNIYTTKEMIQTLKEKIDKKIR